MRTLTSKIGLAACILCFSLLLFAAVSGCKYIGTDTAPPSKYEKYAFDTVTNYVPVVVPKYFTNMIPVDVLEFHTNSVGVPEFKTNHVFVQDITWIPTTNYVAQYIMTPNENSKKAASTAGSISNLIVPGSGGLVAGVITGLLGAWGKLRSSKRKLDESQTTGGVLTQNIQTMREFVKSSIPNGQDADDALTKFMQKHQAEEGVLGNVLQLIEDNVSKPEAKAAAAEVRSVVNPTLGA